MNLILLKNSETKTYESFLNTLKIPVVNENWFEICLRRNILIRPENFLLGHKTISNQISIQREIFHSEMKIISENKLKSKTGCKTDRYVLSNEQLPSYISYIEV